MDTTPTTPDLTPARPAEPLHVLLVDEHGQPVHGIGQPRSIFIDAALGVVSGIVVGYFIRRYAIGGTK